MYASDPNNVVRQTALANLAEIRGKDEIPVLVAVTAPTNTLGQRATAARYLGKFGGAAAEKALIRMTDPIETRNLRINALYALAATGDSAQATSVALNAIVDYDPLFAVQGVQVAARMGGAAAKARLAEMYRTERRVTVRATMEEVLKAH